MMTKTNTSKKLFVLALSVLLLFTLMIPCMASGSMGAGTANGSSIGDEIGKAVGDILPGDNRMGSESSHSTKEHESLTEDGKTDGNARNGMVGGESASPRASESTSSDMQSGTTGTNTTTSGNGWLGILIAILILAALAAVIIALFPKKRA